MITDLRLQNFRLFQDDSFELGAGINIIVGPNASGKTSLLEAVLVLAQGSSFRVASGELIKFNQPWARLDAHNGNYTHRAVKIVREPTPGKLFEIGGNNYQRLSLAQSLPVVIFEPNHLQMFSGGPERRRDYLDDLLEQTTAGYKSLRRQYKRALAQRNRLLKQTNKASSSQLFPWDIRLSQLAGQLVRARSGLAENINHDLPALYNQLSKSKTIVNIIYANQWPVDVYESRLLKRLEATHHEDHLKGFTSSGPHREDLLLTFDGRPAQSVASRGEVRTVVLALKILELKVLQAARGGQSPLLLLDDVFSELDGKRRHALTDHLATYQTFITTTDADIVLQHFTAKSNVIPLG
ncbi:MAG TPA: DNA replication and repair protein RecF [Candidatus Saccharimonadales bacterium]|nr:DNA replication and repair protein RecF [Candidatus Saccharimonadales bacterium]